MVKFKPQDLFMTAEAFLRACAVVDKAAKQNEFITIAVMATLEAFTLELHLKCLILLEEGLRKSGHDLFKLFKFLSPQTRSELTKAFKKYVESWPSFMTEAKQNNFPTDLEPLLIRGRHSFENFRYSHENAGNTNTLWGLKGLTLIIHDRILETKPDWKDALLKEFLNPHTTSVEKQN